MYIPVRRVEPGKHFVWWNGLRGNQFEFVPGQTYYLDLNYQRHTLLFGNDGMELRNEIKTHRIPGRKDLNQATKFITNVQNNKTLIKTRGAEF
jgi:hypothetical protein